MNIIITDEEPADWILSDEIYGLLFANHGTIIISTPVYYTICQCGFEKRVFRFPFRIGCEINEIIIF